MRYYFLRKLGHCTAHSWHVIFFHKFYTICSSHPHSPNAYNSIVNGTVVMYEILRQQGNDHQIYRLWKKKSSSCPVSQVGVKSGPSSRITNIYITQLSPFRTVNLTIYASSKLVLSPNRFDIIGLVYNVGLQSIVQNSKTCIGLAYLVVSYTKSSSQHRGHLAIQEIVCHPISYFFLMTKTFSGGKL